MVGEHIRALKGGRWNHAIDCGDETVIHLADDDAAPRVRRSYRPEFVAGAESVEVVRHRERTFPANEVVARAYSRISEPGLAAVFRDCEAFAEWCVTGRLPAGPPNRAVAAPRVAPVDAPAAASAGTAAAAHSPAPVEPRPAAGGAGSDAAPRKKRARGGRAAPKAHASPKAAPRAGPKAHGNAKAAPRAATKAHGNAKARSKPSAKPKARGAKVARKTTPRAGAARRR